MKARSLRILALTATFALVACGGGDKPEGSGGAAAPPPPSGGVPAPVPAPAPAPSPAPSPAPAPAPPSEEVQRGAALYMRNCASCHGSDPATGTQGIYKGTTPAALQSAYGRIDVMNLFSGALTGRDTQDIAAYISYSVGLN